MKDQTSLNSDPLLIISYDPFFARHSSPRNTLKRNTCTQDVRRIMIDRFRNMQGHSLKTVLYRVSNYICSFEDFYKKQTLGVDPVILLKQILEENLNASFDVHESSNNDMFGKTNKTESGVVEEMSSGKADFCINFSLIPQGVMWLNHVQLLLTGHVFYLVFVVPMPRQVEVLFQYIFQWQVCVGLSLVMFLLSGAALLFVHVFSTLSHNS